MKDKQRKKAQKIINKSVRAVNRSMAIDNLWRGRFFAHQKNAYWHRFEDGSGGELIAVIDIYDKKTGYNKMFYVTNYNADFELFREINNFITQDCYDTTWANRDALYSDTTDYTKIKIKFD